jgi:hypothetical protein
VFDSELIEETGEEVPFNVTNGGNRGGGGGGGGRGSAENSTPKPAQGDLSHLPGFSELRAKIDSGELKPNVTAQSFIEQSSVWGFQGDDRGFMDSPASADSLSFRLHASLTYGSDSPNIAGGISSFGSISRHSRPSGDGSVTRLGYSFSFNYNAAGSDGLFFGAAPNGIRRGSVYVNYDTGSYLGVLTHTNYPAAQVFLNGSSIYNYSSDQIGKGPLDLGEKNLQTHIVAGMACDPSR